MKTEISTHLIEVDAQNGIPIEVRHGMGRQVGGWLVVWQDAPGAFYATNPDADSSRALMLTPTGSFRARIVLLS
ncbi:MAG: hypothetical protein CVV05_15525 [Gammaproteobacteria bacterium HGW-Gammaproteobacteria-1]|jgi:hypothetical protein|nr:MAG: hypothetical protein CVV05_15525 [Gammaproteobacteria bacterium HGW-Gammaproteobacteria-1]